jgi:hypothetical protein
MHDEPLDSGPDGTPASDSSHDPASEPSDGMVCPVCAASYPASTRFCPVDGSVVRPEAGGSDDLTGRVIDERYFLVRTIGVGGMGHVYLGEHLRTRRRCALKVISRRYVSDPDALPRFVREATNAGRISHPSVATLYDFGETEDGMAYLAMEYVDGESLSKLLEREGPLPPARAVEIARQVAEGVGAAHDLGIVHRDLKPGNILLTKDRKGADVVKVVDFGISQAPAAEQQKLTGTGMALGTPQYMSPEQLVGDPVDGRSDVYSLGCVLFEMLTGEHPFNGSAAQLVTRRLTESPPCVRDTNPEIPKSLDELVIKALGRLPQERFPTMEALRDALLAAPTGPVTTAPRRLAAWLGGEPITSPTMPEHPPAEPEPDGSVATAPRATARPRRLRPLGVMAAVGLVILLLGGVRLLTGDREVVGSGTPVGPAAVESGTIEPEAAESGMIEAEAVEAEAVELTSPIVAADADLLVGLWAELARAETEDLEGSYVAAIVRLEETVSRAERLLEGHPGHPFLAMLVDSAQAQISATERRCEADRLVQLRRGMVAPECRPGR